MDNAKELVLPPSKDFGTMGFFFFLILKTEKNVPKSSHCAKKESRNFQ